MQKYKEMIQIQVTTGNTLTFDVRNEKGAKDAAIADIKAYAKQYGHPDKVKGMRVAQCDDEEYFMVDASFTEILSPVISVDYVQIPDD